MICRIVLQTEGQVYGGFVRDNILHDYMADEFYTNNKNDSWENYNNPKIDIKTSFRTLVPRDIDIMFRDNEDYLSFLVKLQSDGFQVIKVNRDNKYKTPTKSTTDNEKKEDGEVKRVKLEVKNNCRIQDITSHRLVDIEFVETIIYIDVTISKSDMVTFDFICNSLAFDNNGLSIRHEETLDFFTVNSLILKKEAELSQLKMIQQQICKMEAVIFCSHGSIHTPDRHRFMKMMIKGWKFKLLFHVRNDEVKEDFLTQLTLLDDINCCIICHETFNRRVSVPGVHCLVDGIKFNCCSASYHPDCFLELLEKHYEHEDVIAFKCVQCAQTMKRRFFKNSMEVFINELKLVI